VGSTPGWWLLVWTVLWSVAQTIATIMIARGRAHKGEIAELRAAIAEIRALLAQKADGVTIEEQVGLLAEKAKVDRHELKLTEHDRRVQKLESELPHLPTREQVHKIEIDVGALRGNVAVIGQALATNTEIARRVENFLLEGRR